MEWIVYLNGFSKNLILYAADDSDNLCSGLNIIYYGDFTDTCHIILFGSNST